MSRRLLGKCLARFRNRLRSVSKSLTLSFNFVVKEHDKDNSGTLNKLEFEAMFAALGIFLATQENRCVYDHFDHNKDGQVTYAEFVDVLKVGITGW